MIHLHFNENFQIASNFHCPIHRIDGGSFTFLEFLFQNKFEAQFNSFFIHCAGKRNHGEIQNIWENELNYPKFLITFLFIFS